jgi:hypothetical protein
VSKRSKWRSVVGDCIALPDLREGSSTFSVDVLWQTKEGGLFSGHAIYPEKEMDLANILNEPMTGMIIKVVSYTGWQYQLNSLAAWRPLPKLFQGEEFRYYWPRQNTPRDQ